MLITELYNGIYRILSNDEQILNYLGIDTTLPQDELLLVKAMRLQKQRRPQNLVDGNLPLISFYSVGGSVLPRNLQVYVASFVFDVYTKNDVELAQRISDRIYELMNGQIPLIPTITTFETEFEEAYESIVQNVDGVYCFTLILNFYISL